MGHDGHPGVREPAHQPQMPLGRLYFHAVASGKLHHP